MKTIFPLVIAAFTFLSNKSQAVVVHSENFISSPEYFNGFEAIGTAQYLGTTYSEGGITVSYVGTLQPNARLVDPVLESAGIWTTWTPEIGGQGNYGWYGPGQGYTDVKLTSAANIESIQFLAGSGWGNSKTYMQYQLLNDGIVVSSGAFEVLTGNYSTGGWAKGEVNTDGSMGYFGFSGGGFDEVRLQNQGFPANTFAPNSFEAGAYDSIASISQVPVPELRSSASLLIVLFGFHQMRSCLRGRAKKEA